MRKLKELLACAMVLVMFALAPFNLLASSHREAPGISRDPSADNTDAYFFRDPVDPSRDKE
jgi:hypothetical protein